jgi:lipoprotein-anchoring transpeptidase ErfK/SrfK
VGCAGGIIWLAKTGQPAAAQQATATPAAQPTAAPSADPAQPTPVPGDTAQPDPTAAPTEGGSLEEPTPPPEPVDKMPYTLYLEKGSFTLTVYGLDENGEYTKVIDSYLVAIGKGAKTPTGTFTLGKRERWHSFGADQAYTQYATSYEGRLYIHGPLYRREENTSMYNNTYREIGTAVTAGCLRTATVAARWIYENCEPGTQIEIVNGSPRGTQAKAWPEITSIYHDPTDVDAR